MMIPSLQDALRWLEAGEIAPDPRAPIDPEEAKHATMVAACFAVHPDVLELILDMTVRRSPVDYRLPEAEYRQYAQLRQGQNQIAAGILRYIAIAQRNEKHAHLALDHPTAVGPGGLSLRGASGGPAEPGGDADWSGGDDAWIGGNSDPFSAI